MAIFGGAFIKSSRGRGRGPIFVFYLNLNFISGQLRLCHGIERDPTNFQICRFLRNSENQILIEKLENEIVLRSRNCQYAVHQETGSKFETQICPECRKVKKVEQLLKRQRLGQVPKRKKIELHVKNRELGSQNCETDFEVKQEESDCGDENDENDENFFEDKIKKAQYSFSSSNSKKLFAPTKTKTCSVLLRPVPHEIIQRLTGK